ncbi:MAG TPA: MATE family efflux transporter [Gemmatimonadales bacterium]|nr:MATE family efflux transporter [Gemmatimonadales bacterium]
MTDTIHDWEHHVSEAVIESTGEHQAHQPGGWWATIREALRGSHQDYTAGPVGRAILLLAIPMVLEMLMESIFAVADVFWVSRLGPEAVATVGITESLLTLIYTAAMGLSIGVTAMVARRIGEKNPAGAAEAAVQGIGLGIGTSILIAAVGVPLAPWVLRFMGAAPEVLAHISYTRIMLGGNVTILLLFLINATFRGAGDAAIAMRTLWLANGINIVLSPLLIFGVGPFPRLGVAGAAIGTNIGRGIGVAYQVYRVLRKDARVVVHRADLVLRPTVMKALLKLSGSGTLQVFISTASWVGLIWILAHFGTDVMAGYLIGIRLIVFALLPSWGLSNAAATMVGQGLGARNPERAEQAVWRAGFYNMVFLGLVGLVFIIGAEPIIGLFRQPPDVALVGVQCLRIVSYGFLFYAFGMVLTQAFNGAGDTWTPTFLNLFCFWLWEVPLAYVLSRTLGWGPQGVFTAITIAFSTIAVASAILFRRGRWKQQRV